MSQPSLAISPVSKVFAGLLLIGSQSRCWSAILFELLSFVLDLINFDPNNYNNIKSWQCHEETTQSPGGWEEHAKIFRSGPQTLIGLIAAISRYDDWKNSF